MDNINKVFKGTVTTYISAIITILTGFMTPVILVKYLSIEAFGSYKLIMSLIVIASSFTSFGLQAVIARYIPDLLVKKRYKAANKLFIVSLLVRFSATSLFILCLWIYRASIFSFLNLPDIFAVFFIPISFIVIISLTKTILGPAFLNAIMEQHVDNYNRIIYAIIRVLFFWVVLYLGHGLNGLIFAWVAIEVLSFSYYGIIAIKRVLRYNSLPGEADHLYLFESKRFIKFGMFSFMTGNLVLFHDILIDNFVISKYLDIENVGIYGLASTIIGLATMLDPGKILKGICSTILVGKYAENKSIEVLNKGYIFINKISLFIFLPALVGLLLICDKLIIYLYNPEFIEASKILYILMPFLIFQSLAGPVSHMIGILEKNHIMLLCGISSIYNLVMDIILVNKFGLTGIAFATGSAMLLQYTLYFVGIKHYYKKIHFPFKTICKISINLIPMILFLFFARSYIVNIYILFAIIPISATLYFATTYKNKIFNEEEKCFINRTVKRKICVF